MRERSRAPLRSGLDDELELGGLDDETRRERILQKVQEPVVIVRPGIPVADRA